MATEAPAASSGIDAHTMVLEGTNAGGKSASAERTENKPPEPVATKKPYRPPTLAHGSTDGGGGGNSQNRDKTRP
jgi:hypothetical protein